MTLISKKFDTKINIVYPYISKSLSKKDSDRIQRTNFFKYESRKSVDAPKVSLYQPTEEISNKDRVLAVESRLKAVEEEFKRLEDSVEDQLKDIVFSYDTTDPNSEDIFAAERDVFGLATGKITYEKYLRTRELNEVITDLIQDIAIENDGVFNVVA